MALALNPLGPDYGTVLLGKILDHTGRRVTILWQDAHEPEVWNGDDLQYKLDRGLLVLTPPPKPRRTRIPKDKLVCKQCGELRKNCDCLRRSATKPEEWAVRDYHPDVQSDDPPLTTSAGSDKVIASTEGDALTPEEKEQKMTTDEKLSAKEVARELGTDARTLRKFFRSGQSPVDPVGQGGRYGIDPKDMKKLRKKFDAWANKKPSTTKAKKDLPDDLPDDFTTVEDEVEEVDLDGLEGPSDDDLEFIDLELDEEDD